MGAIDHHDMAAKVARAAAAGIMTPNELRAMLGMEPTAASTEADSYPVAGQPPKRRAPAPNPLDSCRLSCSRHHHTPLKPY